MKAISFKDVKINEEFQDGKSKWLKMNSRRAKTLDGGTAVFWPEYEVYVNRINKIKKETRKKEG